MRYRVTNATRNTLLGDDVAKATSFAARFMGLMGVRHFPVGSGLYLAPCTSVHTFFMRLPIDVLFLGPGYAVLDVSHALAPWKMSRWYPDAAGVLELPAGLATASGTQVGDTLAFAELPTP
ncbi:MAG: DUF192 domain-containing protein [Archangium sp.]|nr:DUF192 domain-containing protein [Archangium sp.]